MLSLIDILNFTGKHKKIICGGAKRLVGIECSDKFVFYKTCQKLI